MIFRKEEWFSIYQNCHLDDHTDQILSQINALEVYHALEINHALEI